LPLCRRQTTRHLRRTARPWAGVALLSHGKVLPDGSGPRSQLRTEQLCHWDFLDRQRLLIGAMCRFYLGVNFREAMKLAWQGLNSTASYQARHRGPYAFPSGRNELLAMVPIAGGRARSVRNLLQLYVPPAGGSTRFCYVFVVSCAGLVMGVVVDSQRGYDAR